LPFGTLLNLLPSCSIIPPPIESGSTYYFTTDSEIDYEVRFGRKQYNILNTSIVFVVTNEKFEDEEYSMTNKFEVYRVMAALVEIVRQYIKLHQKINCYEYTGEPTQKEMNDEGKARLSLYNRYLPFFLMKNGELSDKSIKLLSEKMIF
jgi:hypothetical protein